MRSCTSPYFLSQALDSVESPISIQAWNTQAEGAERHHISLGLGYGVHEERLSKLSVASVKERRGEDPAAAQLCLAECREFRARPLHVKR